MSERDAERYYEEMRAQAHEDEHRAMVETPPPSAPTSGTLPTRLRAHDVGLLTEAADEIERLAATVARLTEDERGYLNAIEKAEAIALTYRDLAAKAEATVARLTAERDEAEGALAVNRGLVQDLTTALQNRTRERNEAEARATAAETRLREAEQALAELGYTHGEEDQ